MSIKAYSIEKIVLFGDSLMAGYGLPNEHHLSMVLEEPDCILRPPET